MLAIRWLKRSELAAHVEVEHVPLSPYIPYNIQFCAKWVQTLSS